MIVDSHCHLDYLEKAGVLEEVLENADKAGVSLLLTIGTKLSEFSNVLKIAETYPQVYCTVGVHPHEADQEGQSKPEKLLELSEHPKVVGIGETGLDYYYDHSDREQQKRSFRTHIEAARQSQLPLIIHTRNADEEMAHILKEEQKKGDFKGILHCFSSSRELAITAAELGLFISFSGILTFKSAADLQETAKIIPENKILIETDAPYLAPVPLRGKANEPAFIVHTLEKLANLLGKPIEDMAKITSENFFGLFHKIPRDKIAV